MTYPAALDWLYGSQLHGIKLGLEPIRRLCDGLGLDLTGGGGPVFIHVAGTNGKGSVCAMIDAICRSAGLRTGLYTSPHLITFRERIRLDGEQISERDVAAGLTAIRDLSADWEHAPTFFEIATALALAWFRDQRVQVAVLETGLGGRLDATNVVTPAVSVLTSIGLDHTHYLGTTIAEIAAEKAGIIKARVPVVSAPQVPEARAVIRRVAEKQHAHLFTVTQPWDRSPAGLPGLHQRWNAMLAFAAAKAIRLGVTIGDASRGLAAVSWPGRFQRIGDRIVLDGAHNPDAAARLAETWRGEFGAEKATLILGAMRDKDVRAICAALRPIAARVIAVPVQNPRACTPPELCEIARGVDPGWPCEPVASIAAALAAAERHAEKILIAGSLFLVGEVLAHFDPASAAPERTVQ